MAQIQNIERLREGVFPNLLGYGDIKIFLNASSGIKTFETVPNVRFHFRCLSRQKEARRLTDVESTKSRISQFTSQSPSQSPSQSINVPINNNKQLDKSIPVER